MKDKLITIITLIILFTLTVNFTNVSHGQNLPAGGKEKFEYNFENMSSGAFPINTTWVSFSVYNPAGETKISVQDINGSNALNVFSVNSNAIDNGENGNDTFLCMNFTGAENSTIAMNITYSENNAGGYENNKIVFLSGGIKLAEIRFLEAENLTEIYPSEERAIGPETFTGRTYEMSFTYEDNEIMIQLSNSVAGLPLEIPIISGGENLEMMIGSEAVNLSIYNISMSHRVFMPSYSEIKYDEATFTLPPGMGGIPEPDRSLNSILFTSDHGISVYNYKNETSWFIYEQNSEFNSSFIYGGFLYSYFYNGSSVVVRTNLSDLKSASVYYNYSPEGQMNIIVSSGGIYLYNKSSIINLNETIKFYNYGGQGRIFAIQAGKTDEFYFYNNSARGFRIIKLVADSESVTYIPYGISTFNVTGIEGYSMPSEPFLYNGYFNVFAASMNSSLLIPIRDAVSNGNAVANGTSFLYNGSIYSGNLNISGNYFIISQNYLFDVSGRQLSLFYHNTSIYSGNRISVSIKNYETLRGNELINTSVNSNVSFHLYVSDRDFKKFLNDNTSFLFNTYEAGNGSSVLNISAENIAGYGYNISETIFIDDYNPLFAISIANNSYIKNGTVISINVTDPAGIRTLNVSYENYNYISSGNISIPVYFKDTSCTCVYVNFTDRYGLNFSRFFVFHTVTANTSAFVSSVKNDEFFNNSMIYFNFSDPSFSNYAVNVTGNASVSFLCNGSFESSLGNGKYTMKVSGISHGISVFLYEANFTVITYKPGIMTVFRNLHYYSFYGDSMNNTIILSINSNITALLNARIINPENKSTTVYSSFSGGKLKLTNVSGLFNINGTYSIVITATSMSGTSNKTYYNFTVNNTVPTSENFTIYTNSTSIRIPFNSTGYVLNGVLQNSSVLNLGGYGNFTFLFYNYTESMNYGIFNLTVHSSRSRPVICFNVSSYMLNLTDKLVIWVSPGDLMNETLHVDEKEFNFTGRSAEVNFSANGLYTVYVSGKNIYGNFNKSGIAVINVSYYPQLFGISLYSTVSGGSLIAYLNINGIKWKNMTEIWDFDGHRYTGKTGRDFDLKYGKNEISVEVISGNVTMMDKRVIYYYGNLPYISFIALIPGILYVATRNRDIDYLRSYISETGEESIRKIVKAAKKKRFSGRSIRREIRRLVNTGSATIREDPDGNLYLVRSKM